MKMKKGIVTVLALVGLMSVNGQEQDKTLLTVDGEEIRQSEFVYIYEKNNQETTMDQKSVDEYLDLFINFRLKVHEAEKQGLDTTTSFKQELAGYRAQATPKYMTYEAGEDSMARLSYDHIAHDRRAAHIAIQCPMNADDSTVAAALAKINDARLRVVEGKAKEMTQKEMKKLGVQGTKIKGTKKYLVKVPEDFVAVAMEVSEDPGLQQSKGELGWITPFRYVWPLEKAVYETEVGKVSEVFRTGFGFHVALVEEERPHMEVNARHIMKMTPRGNDSLAVVAKQQIDSLRLLLVKDGRDFAQVAEFNSDDRGSATRGGELGWFSRGMMVKPFEDAVFAMKDSGEISEPVKSQFGWHLIRLEGKRGVRPFSEMENDLRKQVRSDERHKEVDKAFVKKIRAEYKLPETMSDEQVLQVENANLENKYPEFKNLVKEYHDGILLFDVSLKNVWDKAAQDTTGLEKFFKKHKKEYKWDGPRYKGFVLYGKDKESLKAAKAIVRAANPDSVASYIEHRINNDSVKFVKVERGLWPKGANAAVDKLQWKEGEWAPKEDYPEVVLVGKVLKAPEEYLDERGKVVSAYQDELEAAWIKELKAKYPVVINEEALAEIKAKYAK